MNCKTAFSRQIWRLVDLGWWSWLMGLCLDPAPPLGEVLRCAFPGSSAHHSPGPSAHPTLTRMGRVHGVVEKNPMGSEAIFCGDRLRCKVFKETKKEASFSSKRWLLSHRFFLDLQLIKYSAEPVDVLRIFRGIVEPMRGLGFGPGQITSIQQLRTD